MKYTEEEIKELLSKVAEVINDSCADENALRFREIITALRGPDFDDPFDLKWKTTAIIRGVIGIHDFSGLEVNPSIKDFKIETTSDHFNQHISRAMRALQHFHLWEVTNGK